MWKRFKNFIFILVHLFSFKKGKNVNSDTTSNSNTPSQDETKSQDTALEIDNSEKLEEKDGIFYDVLSEEDWQKQYAEEEKKVYKNDKFYSLNSLQEVTKFTDHENTFAAAMFECSVDKQSRNNNDGYQLTGLELKSDQDSKLEFSSKQSSIKLSSDHLRLYMPFFFADKNQNSIDELFQYSSKDGITSTPGIVILLEKPDSINLDPNFEDFYRPKRSIYNQIWGIIKNSETKKSSRIPKALFPTFTVELEGQNINFSIEKNAIPQSMEDLKDEKSTIKAILAIPGISSLVTGVISDILDKITDGIEKTSFRIKDVLICGKIINELQVQNSVVKEDESHSITSNEGYGLSQATVSCINLKEAKL